MLVDPVTRHEELALSVKGLGVRFATPHGTLNAVTGLNVDLRPSEILGVVGESGSGKTTVLLAIAGAVASNAEVTGSVMVNQTNVVHASARQLQQLRQRELGFVFQNPMSSLNPVLRIGYQLTERLRVCSGLSRTAARREAIDLLTRVGIPAPEKSLKAYPHEFSGGMRQRVMLAIALSVKPRLLLADEPTSALDDTTAQQVLRLITTMCKELRTAVIIVTHDLQLASKYCTRILVMYGGYVVESGSPSILTAHPDHPYTRGLLASMSGTSAEPQTMLPAIPNPDVLDEKVLGCSFATRCSFARPACRDHEPQLTPRRQGNLARCFGTEERGGWIR